MSLPAGFVTAAYSKLETFPPLLLAVRDLVGRQIVEIIVPVNVQGAQVGLMRILELQPGIIGSRFPGTSPNIPCRTCCRDSCFI